MREKNFVYFKNTLIPRIENTLKNSIKNKDTLEYIVKKLKQAPYNVVDVDTINILDELVTYSIESYKYCYFEDEVEILEGVELSKKFYDYIERLIVKGDISRKASIFYREYVISKGKRVIPKKELYRFSEIMDEDFSNYILRTILLYDCSTFKPMEKKQVQDKVYSIARMLSGNRYNYGYKIDYDTASIIIEKGYMMELIWANDCLYYNGDLVSSLVEANDRICKLIDKKFRVEEKEAEIKRRRKELEERLNELENARIY